MSGIIASRQLMAKPLPAVQPIELDCADGTTALQMTRWLTHLRAERRLSPNASPFSVSIGARK
jgi:hypothetical protein